MNKINLEKLKEKIAEIEHMQWMSWAKALMNTENISTERKNRWEKLFVPYRELSEQQKELDRVEAEVIMELLEKERVIY